MSMPHGGTSDNNKRRMELTRSSILLLLAERRGFEPLKRC